jgi:hypothetical protein
MGCNRRVPGGHIMLPRVGATTDSCPVLECSEEVADLWRAAIGCIDVKRDDLLIHFLGEAVRLATAENRVDATLAERARREAGQRNLLVAADMVEVLTGSDNGSDRVQNVFELFRAAFLLLEIAYNARPNETT